MKKRILTVLMAISLGFAFAQVPDASFTDCNNNTRSIYQVLAAGKILVVANSGTNCSICMSHASSVGNLATNNQSTMEVWGAMTTKNGGLTNCTTASNWVTTYNWMDVFTFLDSNKYWFQVGTPRYTVIDPADSSIAYQGSNWTAAQSTAQQLANSIGLDEEELISGVSVSNNAISITTSQALENGNASLYNLTGARIETWQLPSGVSNFELQFNSTRKQGLYLLRLEMNGREYVERIFL